MKNGKLEKKNIIKDKSFNFAIRIVKLYQYLTKAENNFPFSTFHLPFTKTKGIQ